MWQWLRSLTIQEGGIIFGGMLGLYGAVLSTVNALTLRREKRRRLKVTLEVGTVYEGQGKESAQKVRVQIRNDGLLPVTLAVIFFRYKSSPLKKGNFWFEGGNRFKVHQGIPGIQVTAVLPHELKPGTSFDYVVELATMKHAFMVTDTASRSRIRVQAACRDQVRKCFYSNWIKIAKAPGADQNSATRGDHPKEM